MSYVFTQQWRRDKLSGLGVYQLQRPGHISQVWKRDKLAGLGTAAEFIGPDQPWSAQTASTWLTPRTRQCGGGKEILIGGIRPTQNYVGGHPVDMASCYATGRIKEASKAGYGRTQEWCCTVNRPTAPLTKPATQEQAEQYATLCADKVLSLPSGQSVLTTLGYWLHKSGNLPTGMCLASGVVDGDYKLLCCREPDTSVFVVKDGKTYLKKPTVAPVADPTASQIETQTRQQVEQAARTEAALVAAQEPEYGIWDRYKWVIILGGGAVVIGLLAGGLKKKFSKSEA